MTTPSKLECQGVIKVSGSRYIGAATKYNQGTLLVTYEQGIPYLEVKLYGTRILEGRNKFKLTAERIRRVTLRTDFLRVEFFSSITIVLKSTNAKPKEDLKNYLESIKHGTSPCRTKLMPLKSSTPQVVNERNIEKHDYTDDIPVLDMFCTSSTTPLKKARSAGSLNSYDQGLGIGNISTTSPSSFTRSNSRMKDSRCRELFVDGDHDSTKENRIDLDEFNPFPNDDQDIIYVQSASVDKMNRSLPLPDKTDEFKHLSQNRVCTEKKKPVDFLKKGAEKASIQTTSFYKTQAGSSPMQLLNRQLVGSGSSFKRKPGLLPENPRAKKPCTFNRGNIYSMNHRKIDGYLTSNTKLQGFSNLGNTCYMNAILQSLYCLDTFVSDLIHKPEPHVLDLMSKDSLFVRMMQLWKVKDKTSSNGNIGSSITECLEKVKSAISTSAKRFSGYNQHDAHEFLSQVLDQLKEEVLKTNDNEQPSPQKGHQSSSDILNPTILNFECDVVDIFKCNRCLNTVETCNKYYDFSVEFPRRRDGKQCSLQDALLSFFKRPEKVTDYNCENCHEKTEANVEHQITKVPRVLTIHVKRYSYNTMSIRKIGKPLIIPKFVTLYPFSDCDAKAPYAITSTIKSSKFRIPLMSRNDENRGTRDDVDGRDFKTSDLKEVEKSDFKKAIENSKTDTGRSSSCYDEDLKRALENSIRDTGPQNVIHLDEEEQMRLALEESRKDSLWSEPISVGQNVPLPGDENRSKDINGAPTSPIAMVDLDDEEEAIKKAKELSLREIEPLEGAVQNECIDLTYLDEIDGIEAFIDQKIKENCENSELPHSYTLMSVVSHKGDSSKIGHYIADVFSIKKNKWFSYDDSYVKEINETEVRQKRECDGYIFFYMHNDTVSYIKAAYATKS